MSASPAMREKLHRAYMEFFETAERKRRWTLWDDIPWDELDTDQHDEDKACCIATFCGVELYVPDYTGGGLALTRDVFGDAWFTANWGYEESKHGLVLREYLIRSGLRSEEQYNDFERRIFEKVWPMPYETTRAVKCYSTLQEIATFLIYKSARRRAKEEGDVVLERIYYFLARDEAAHAGFYRRSLEFAMEEDRAGTLADLARATFSFEMPGVGYVPDFEKNVDRVRGVAITPQHFLEHGVYPLLRKLGTTRAELVRAHRLHRHEREQLPGHVRAQEPANVIGAA